MQPKATLKYSKPKARSNQVLVYITTEEFVHARDVLELQSHRDLMVLKFQEKGYAVVKPEELRYYYQPKHMIVEGIKGQSVLSL